MTKQNLIGCNVLIVSSYMIFGHTEDAGEVMDQGKTSATIVTTHSVVNCDILVDAFAEAGFTERVQVSHLLLKQECHR